MITYYRKEKAVTKEYDEGKNSNNKNSSPESLDVWENIFEEADKKIREELGEHFSDVHKMIADQSNSVNSKVETDIENVDFATKEEPISLFPTVDEIIKLRQRFGSDELKLTDLLIKELQVFIKKRREKVLSRLQKEYLRNVATIDKYYYGMIYDCLLSSTSTKNIDNENDEYVCETNFTQITKFYDNCFTQEEDYEQ